MTKPNPQSKPQSRKQLSIEPLEPRVLLAAPVITSLQDNPDNVPEFSATLTDENVQLQLTAYGVSDADGGAITSVEVFRSQDSVFGNGDDVSLGYAAQIGVSVNYRWTGDATWAPGYWYYFAEATDDQGEISAAASAYGLVNDRPVVASLTGSPEPIAEGDTLTLTATGVTDTWENVQYIDFYLDIDSDAAFTDTVDVWIGRDTEASDGWSWTGEVRWPEGGYFAVPTDNYGALGEATFGWVNQKVIVRDVSVTGGSPGVNQTPNPVWAGQGVQFFINNAADVYDPDGGTVVAVQFWRDGNGDEIFNENDDVLLGTDTDASGGWTTGVILCDWDPDVNYTYFARGLDDGNIHDAFDTGDYGDATPTINQSPRVTEVVPNTEAFTLSGSVILEALGVTDADGYVDLVAFSSGVAGYFDYSAGGGWSVTTDVGEWHLTDAVMADFNNDGAMDIAVGVQPDSTVSNDFITVMLNDGNGEFLEIYELPLGAYSVVPYDLDVGDFNNDGAMDIVFGSGYDYLNIFENGGDGTTWTQKGSPIVSSDTPIFPTHEWVAAAYLNNDANMDVVIGSMAEGEIIVMFGSGDGFFTEDRGYYYPGPDDGSKVVPQAVETGDFDQDGDEDIAFVSYDGLFLMWNNGNGNFADVGHKIAYSQETAITGGDNETRIYGPIYRIGYLYDEYPNGSDSPGVFYPEISDSDVDLYKMILEDGQDVIVYVRPHDTSEATLEPWLEIFDADGYPLGDLLIVSDNLQFEETGAANPVRNSLSSVDIMFNRPIDPTTFTAGDVGWTGPGGISGVAAITTGTAISNTAFRLTFNNAVTTPGSYTMWINAGSVRDETGYRLLDQTYTIDVDISSEEGLQVSNVAPVFSWNYINNFVVTFNQEPNTFTSSNVRLWSPTGGLISTLVTGSGTSYTVQPRSGNANIQLLPDADGSPGVYTLEVFGATWAIPDELHVYDGTNPWATANNSTGSQDSSIRYFDANSNGRHDSDENVWWDVGTTSGRYDAGDLELYNGGSATPLNQVGRSSVGSNIWYSNLDQYGGFQANDDIFTYGEDFWVDVAGGADGVYDTVAVADQAFLSARNPSWEIVDGTVGIHGNIYFVDNAGGTANVWEYGEDIYASYDGNATWDGTAAGDVILWTGGSQDLSNSPASPVAGSQVGLYFADAGEDEVWSDRNGDNRYTAAYDAAMDQNLDGTTGDSFEGYLTVYSSGYREYTNDSGPGYVYVGVSGYANRLYDIVWGTGAVSGSSAGEYQLEIYTFASPNTDTPDVIYGAGDSLLSVELGEEDYVHSVPQMVDLDLLTANSMTNTLSVYYSDLYNYGGTLGVRYLGLYPNEDWWDYTASDTYITEAGPSSISVANINFDVWPQTSIQRMDVVVSNYDAGSLNVFIYDAWDVSNPAFGTLDVTTGYVGDGYIIEDYTLDGPFDEPVATLLYDFDGDEDGQYDIVVAEKFNIAVMRHLDPYNRTDPKHLDPYPHEYPQVGDMFGFDRYYSVVVDKMVTYTATPYDEDYDPIPYPEYGGWGNSVFFEAPVNQRPRIFQLWPSRENLDGLETITIEARGVQDLDGQVETVEFWRDMNGNYQIDEGIDTLLRVDSNGNDGWKWSGPLSVTGDDIFLARATDNYGGVSDTMDTEINKFPTIDIMYANGAYNSGGPTPSTPNDTLIFDFTGLLNNGDLGYRGDLLFRDAIQNGRWDFDDVNGDTLYDPQGGEQAEDVWKDANGNYRYDWEYEVLGGVDNWTAVSGTAGIHGNLYVNDTDGNGRFNWVDEIWADLAGGTAGVYDEGIDTKVYFGSDGAWNALNGLVGVQANIYFVDNIIPNGQWNDGEDIFADAANGANAGVYNPLRESIASSGNTRFAVYDGGDGYQSESSSTMVMAAARFADMNGDNIFNWGEEAWFDNGDGVYTSADIAIWDGGDGSWDTPDDGSVAGSNNMRGFFYDADSSTTFTAGDDAYVEMWDTEDNGVGINGNILFEDNNANYLWDYPEAFWAEGIYEQQSLTLYAVDVIEGENSGGSYIRAVHFYRDSNFNGVFDPKTDEWLGRADLADGNLRDGAQDEWSYTIPNAEWQTRTQTFFAVAQDSHDLWSAPVAASVSLENRPPDITSIDVDPGVVVEGDILTLTALGVNDPFGDVVQVNFYRDVNTNGVIDDGDIFLGSDVNNDGDDAWVWSGTASWAIGDHWYLARALDNDGAWSVATVTAMGTINGRPVFGGTFYNAHTEYSVAGTPQDVIVGDFNSDGVPDLVTVGSSSLLLGNGDATFQAATDIVLAGTPDLIGAVTGRFNGDEALDLVFADRSGLGQVRILLGDDLGNFTEQTAVALPALPLAIVRGDFDGDEYDDVATLNEDGSISVLFSNGDGSLQPPVNYTVLGPSPDIVNFAAARLDGDDYLDLAVVDNDGGGTVHILLGNGNGTFTEQVSSPLNVGGGPVAVVAQDFDRDNYIDLAVVNSADDTVSLLWGNGDGTFTAGTNLALAAGAGPGDIVAAFVDSDDRRDLVVSMPALDQVAVFLNDGQRVFLPSQNYDTADGPRALLLRDLDDDLAIDIVTANQGSGDVSIVRGVGGLIDTDLLVENLGESYDPIGQADMIVLQATGLRDVDGSINNGGIVLVEFWRDTDGNGTFSNTIDQRLDPDLVSHVSDYRGQEVWSWAGTVTWSVGQQTYFVVAQDNQGDWSYDVLEPGVVYNPLPVISGGLLDSPDPAHEGHSFTLTARTVTDSNGSVKQVRFYRETNGRAGLQTAEDEVLGTITQGVSGDYSLVTTVTWDPGAHTYYARAQDNDDDWGVEVSVQGVVNDRPLVDSLSVDRTKLRPGQSITLTANGVSDPGGPNPGVDYVEFFRDSDGDQLFTSGVDQLIGTDSNGVDGWTLFFVPESEAHVFFARARDFDGGYSVAATSPYVNRLPIVLSITDLPDPVVIGDTITIEAGGVSDPDGSVVAVEFWRDTNGNGVLETERDALITTDGTAADGWGWSGIVTWGGGAHTYFARALDNYGDYTDSRDVPSADGYVRARPIIDTFTVSPDPVNEGDGYTLTVTTTSPDSPVAEVRFYLDENANSLLDVSTDSLLFIDYDIADGWITVPELSNTGWAAGQHTFLAVAIDEEGVTSTTAVVVGTVNGRPVIGDLIDNPDPVVRSEAFTLTAQNVTDTDGTVVSVEFYRDTDGNDVLDTGVDSYVGAGILQANGLDWVWSGQADWLSGPHTYFAIATDDLGALSDVAQEDGDVKERPTIGALDDSPDPVILNEELTLSANGVSDADGTVVLVEFYRDLNGNNSLDGADILLGADGNGANGWSWTGPATWASGTYTYFARAQDNDGLWSVPEASTLGEVNERPVINAMYDTPDPVNQGENLTLWVTGVTDFDGTVMQVEFYRDSNTTGVFEEGVDELLGIDTEASDGWSYTGAATWDGGTHIYFARALDDDNAYNSPVVSTTGDVNLLPAIGGLSNAPDPATFAGILTLTANPVTDSDGTVMRVQFYRDVNDNDQIDTGIDQLLLDDTDDSNGWGYSGIVTWTSGSYTYMARAQDDDGGWSPTALAEGRVNLRPTITALTDTPATVNKGDSNLRLEATGVADSDGTVARVEFYRESNGNSQFDAGIDEFIEADSDGSDGWWVDNFTVDWDSGTHTYYARALDNDSAWSSPVVSTTGEVNDRPTVGGFTALPGTIVTGDTVNFEATGVADADDSVVKVEFWLDDGDGNFETDEDTLLATDSTDAGTGIWTGSATSQAAWGFGSKTYFAVAYDEDGAINNPVETATNDLQSRPVIGALVDSPDPVTIPLGAGDTFSLTATGVTDLDGTVVSVTFYRDANGDGNLQGLTDDELGTDTNGADGWSWTAPTDGPLDWASGNYYYFAVAVDNDGQASESKRTEGGVNDRPTITDLQDNPDPVTEGGSVVLTATGVTDSDGTIAKVEFYRDENGNDTLDIGTDTYLGDGTATGTAGEYEYTVASVGNGPATVTYLVRAQDDDGAWSDDVAEDNRINDRPTITSLTAPDAIRDDNITLTANGVADTDGTVAQVAFYLDDGDNVFDAGDTLLGTDTNAAGGWTWTQQVTWGPGDYRYYAVATDNDGATSNAAQDDGHVNVRPGIAYLTDTPDPVVQGEQLTLAAVNVTDVDGSVTQVRFYRDENNNDTLDIGTDTLLGTDTTSGDGFTWTGTATWLPGDHTYLAQALDNDGLTSLVVNTDGHVNKRPSIATLADSPDPAMSGSNLTLTAGGVNDDDGTVTKVDFYRDVNGNGTLDIGTDALLGTDNSAAGGWTWTGTASWSAGTYKYFAVATDNDGLTNEANPAVTEGDINYTLLATMTRNGVTVSFFDTNTANGTIAPNIAWNGSQFVRGQTDVYVVWGSGQNVNAIILYNGTGGTQDLGISVEGNAMLGKVIDTRASAPIGFLVSQGPVYTTIIKSDVQGANLNGMALPGGWILPTDIDGDGGMFDTTSFYSPSFFSVAVVYGDVGGDMVSNQLLNVYKIIGGDHVGDVRVNNGTLNTFITLAQWNGVDYVGGDVLGDVSARSINVGLALGGNISGDVRATNGQITTLKTQAYYDRVPGVWKGGDISGDVSATGPIYGLYAIGGDVSGDVTSTSSMVRTFLSTAVNAGGVVSGGNVSGTTTAAGGISTFLAGRDFTGQIDVTGTFSVMKVLGNVNGGQVNVTGNFNLMYTVGSYLQSNVNVSGYFSRMITGGDFTDGNVFANQLYVVTIGGTVSGENGDGGALNYDINANTGQFYVFLPYGFRRTITAGLPVDLGGVFASVG